MSLRINDYRCENNECKHCGEVIELYVSTKAERNPLCDTCGTEMKLVLNGVNRHLSWTTWRMM